MATQKADKEVLLPIINKQALEQRARLFVQGMNLPKISGQFAEARDINGEPVPVGEIIVLQAFCDELEEMLLPLIQDQFKAATYRMAEVFDPESIDSNGRPVIENKFRIVPPFKGGLKLDRYDRMRALSAG